MNCKYGIVETWGKGVKICALERGIYVWLPKSQVTIEDNFVTEIPEWLIKKNNLKPELNAELRATT